MHHNEVMTVGELYEKVNAGHIESDIDMQREIFRRINTLGVPLSPYEVINGLYNGEYLRGLTAYVASYKSAIKVLGANSRGKNQLRVLQFLQQLHDRKTGQASIYDWVAERKDRSFADDQRKVDRNIDFIAAVFEDMSLAQIYFDLSMRHLNSQSLWVQHKREINKAIKDYKKSDNWKLTSDKARDIEDIIMACVGGIELDPRRFFTSEQRAELLERAGCEDGKYPCAGCGKLFFADELQADHIEAWSRGGRTEVSNGQMLCRVCNTAKSNS